MREREMRSWPSDLVPFADLVHAPREGAEGSEEDGDGAGALGRNAAGVSDRREAAGRRAVLENRHLLHAHHPRLLPYHRLRHLLRDGWIRYVTDFRFWVSERGDWMKSLAWSRVDLRNRLFPRWKSPEWIDFPLFLSSKKSVVTSPCNVARAERLDPIAWCLS